MKTIKFRPVRIMLATHEDRVRARDMVEVIRKKGVRAESILRTSPDTKVQEVVVMVDEALVEVARKAVEGM